MPGSLAEEPLGYILLGVFISLWLCGIISLQTLNFYTSYPRERKWLKVFVGILIVADGLQTLMGVGIIWNILIKNFGNVHAVQSSTRMFQIYPVLVGLISGSVQVFFAWRIKVLSTSLVLFTFIVILAIPQFAGGIAYTVLTVQAGRFTDLSDFVGVIIGWVASSVVCDLAITTTLTMILQKHRANRDLGEAARLMDRIKTMSIHNGLVTILWSFALLIALAASQNRGAYYMFFYPLGKVYLITMLASLNSRPVVRPELDPRIQSALQRSSIPPVSHPSSSSPKGSVGDVEKIARPISQASNHSRAGSIEVGYLSVAQEDDEDIFPSHGNDERPSDSTEVQPLVWEPPPKRAPKPPPRTISGTLNRPRGPRLQSAPYPAARSVSV